MNCLSAISTARTTNAAYHQILEQLDEQQGNATADLTLVFSSMHHADELGRIASLLRSENRTRHVLGCTGESIVGGGKELEGTPALSVWTINLPGASIRPLRLGEPGESQIAWAQELENRDQSLVILLADPFSYRTDDFLNQLNQQHRGLRVVGGMASGSRAPRGNQLVLDDQAFAEGGVAMLLTSPLAMATVVSQGCRPVGRTMIITKAEQNIIRELGRRPALETLRDMFQELDNDDKRRIQDGLHIGRVINEFQGTFQRGDFLVRNVMGADDSGAIQINDLVRVGQTVQFHVRDAETADEDLRMLLQSRTSTRRPLGALLFTCNGRGTRLFETSNHDVSVIQEVCGPIPVAGFFAMGEIGPIGNQNFLHGFTASIVIFEQPE